MPTERDLFIDWMESSYPGLGTFVDAMWGDAWVDTEHYRHWATLGKPSGAGGTLTPEQAYEQELVRAREVAEGFDFPEGVTYSPEAAWQRSERLRTQIQQLDILISQIAGVAHTHPSNITNTEIWATLTPEQQNQIRDIYRQREILAQEMIALQGVGGLGELETLGAGGWAERYPAPAQPYIPTPEWLTTYVPELEAGGPLSRQALTTPSAQAWGRMPWHQREMFGGYAEYAPTGGIKTMRDLEEAIAANIPRRRELTPRWKPAFQR